MKTQVQSSKAAVDRQALRQQFLLRPDIVFLNHGSFGACPRPVFEVYQDWQRELEREPVEFLSRRFKQLMQASRSALGQYLSVNGDDLVYVPNATTGLNVVARSLPLQAGDEVLATDHEYGALDRTWRFVCQKRGSRYINQPLDLPVESQAQVIEAIWSGVTPRTRVLFVSHITSSTAIILPIAELVRRARAAGIWTVVDGAHAPGQIPLNLTELGADFYAGNCHKWLCAPKGSAFLYARPEVQPLLEPLVVSWGWQSDEPGSSRFVDEHEWQGTRDIAAYLSVPAAIAFQAEHDWPRVRLDCHQLLRNTRNAICHVAGLAATTPDANAWYCQMAACLLPPCDARVLQRRLYEEFAIEVLITRWRGHQLLRVSVQGYNTKQDVDRLVSVVGLLLPQVRKA